MKAYRREFTRGQKKAVKRLYVGVCAACGAEGVEVDHITPAARGGDNSGDNAQALCRTCNAGLSDSIKPASGGFTITKPVSALKPRNWQKKCLAAQLDAIRSGNGAFFTAAGVGSGKTLQTLSLYLESEFDLLLIIVPKSGIRGAWLDDAKKMGINLEPVLDGSTFIGPSTRGSEYVMPHGFVLTVQMLPSVINDINLYGQKFSMMGCVDEAHHYGEGMSWDENAKAALAHCKFVVGLSGTPTRDDDKCILALDYLRNDTLFYAAPSHTYHYEEALADGHVAPVVGRFIGGEIDKHHVDGRVETYKYSDGDYSHMEGVNRQALMSERLRLSALESAEWQYAAVAEARKQLNACGSAHPWGGLVACCRQEQAKAVQAHIESTYGEKCLLVVGDEQTEEAVALFSADTSYRWIISITKISEGISIDRLRVGVLLSNWTTRTNFDQLRGRLCRLVKGIPQLEQEAYFYVPADPRIQEHALSSNQMMLHSVPWLKKIALDDEVIDTSRETVIKDDSAAAADMGEGQNTVESIRKLRESLENKQVIDIGAYRLFARPEMDGAAINDEFIPEDEYLALRNNWAGVINPHTAMLIQGNALERLDLIFGDI